MLKSGLKNFFPERIFLYKIKVKIKIHPQFDTFKLDVLDLVIKKGEHIYYIM